MIWIVMVHELTIIVYIGNYIIIICMYIKLTERNKDYAPGPFIVVFKTGITRVPFKVSLHDDNVFEDDENFTLSIEQSSLPSNINIRDPSQATVTIKDDDCKLIGCLFVT